MDLLCGSCCFVLAIHHIESNSFETFQASSNHCLFMRKLTLVHLWCMTNDRSCCRWWKKLVWSSHHTSVVFQALQDFTYIAFKDLLCGNSIVLAIHHIESNSFETFDASSNHCHFMRKLILGHLWCTTERLLEIACDSNFFPLFFVPEFLKVSKVLQNGLKLCTNDRSCCRWWKKLVWSGLHTSLWFCRVSKIWPI